MSGLSSGNLKFKIIDNTSLKDKFFCDFCGYVNTFNEDFISSKEYGCCNNCYLTFIESKKNVWRKDDKPNKEILDSYIKLKEKIIAQES